MKTKWCIAFLVIILLTGCLSNTNEKQTETMTGNIKVMTWLDETYFNQMYGSYFQSKYPNIDVELYSARELVSSEQFDNMYDEIQPDVLVVDAITYERYAEQNKLLQLDALIQADRFEVEDIHPSITRYLKVKGGGDLLGLSPSFSTFTLFFNKKLFDQYNIDIPIDRMSWDEVIHLAWLFSENEDVIGLLLPKKSPFMMAKIIARSKNMSYLDVDHQNITIGSAEWFNILEQVVSLYEVDKEPEMTGKVNYASRSEYLKADAFISGQAAMAFNASSFIGELQYVSRLKDIPDLEWDIVTGPINPLSPDVDPYFAVGEIFSITSNTNSKDEAWEFVKYFNNTLFAIAKSKLSSELSARTSLIKDDQGHHLTSLFMLEYGENNIDFNEIDDMFQYQFELIANEQLYRVIEGDLDLSEAISVILQKGAEELAKLQIDESS